MLLRAPAVLTLLASSLAAQNPGDLKALFVRPRMTYYKVEAVQPGNRNGTSFAVLFFDGAQWTFLGRAWQYMPE
jgi:hypothetical protein